MLNKVTIMGRLCADPDLRQTQSGIPVANIRIATERDFLNSGERETDFLDVVAWRGTAEFIANYFTKGRMIVVDGRLQTKTWVDRDGKNRVSVEIVAENAYFGDSKRADQSADRSYGDPATDQPYGEPATRSRGRAAAGRSRGKAA